MKSSIALTVWALVVCAMSAASLLWGGLGADSEWVPSRGTAAIMSGWLALKFVQDIRR